MKTKKLFLMAAMLLTSVCTFAQNSTPLKGDVNEDGTVDVADLVSIMKIMKDAGGAVGEKTCYWYAGVNGGNAVTETNFTDIASKIAESQIPQTGFVTAADQYVYFVMLETRFMSSLTDANGIAVDYDCTDAYGYHIYKTQKKYSGELSYGIAERIYYWYAGTTEPTSSNLASIMTSSTNAKPTTWTSNPQSVSITNNTGSPAYFYYCFPTEWNVKIYDGLNGSEMSLADVSTFTLNGIEYTVKRMGRQQAAGATQNLYARC